MSDARRRFGCCGHMNSPFTLGRDTTRDEIAASLRCERGCSIFSAHPDGIAGAYCDCGCSPPKETARDAWERASATLRARGGAQHVAGK